MSANRSLCGHCREPLFSNEAEAAIYLPKLVDIKREMKGVDKGELALSLGSAVCEDIRRASDERGFGNKPKVKWTDDPHMLELCIMDAHLSKLAWGEETGGANYDMAVCEQRVDDAVDDLLAQAHGYVLEKIVLPWGNDFFHYDTLSGTTTAGTPLDRDSRFQKMFRKGRAIASRAIRKCAEIAPVDLVIVPGNHDEITSFLLGEVLAAEFENDARVTVDNSPRLRKYVRYGANLIGFTHGKEEPHKKLPLIMAQEVPELWAATRFREFHTGHFHKSKVADSVPVDSHNGVRVRTLQSLSGTDAWHAKMGYVGETGGAEAFVWSANKGLRANLFYLLREAAA